MRRLRLTVLLALAAVVPAAPALAHPRLIVERAVLVMRHGIRAPLVGEVPPATRTAAPWPNWPVAAGRITPHGAHMLAMAGRQDRRLLARRGLIPTTGCPTAGMVRITTNSAERTIASGAAYAGGLAPGCDLVVAHRDMGVIDPLFEPLALRPATFDAAAAIADIDRATGGIVALERRNRVAIDALNGILGCSGDCASAGPGGVIADADGRGIALRGSIRATSGIAQVLLLQYLEGMPDAHVGWGRVDVGGLQRLGALHAALFAVFTRPPYMAAHQARAMVAHILAALEQGSRFDVLIGHDTNVTALAAVLHVHLRAPGYAVNDVPPDGGLLFERLLDARTQHSFVRISYRTQSPEALRRSTTAVTIRPLRIPGCGGVLCPMKRLAAMLHRRVAPAELTTDNDVGRYRFK